MLAPRQHPLPPIALRLNAQRGGALRHQPLRWLGAKVLAAAAALAGAVGGMAGVGVGVGAFAFAFAFAPTQAQAQDMQSAQSAQAFEALGAQWLEQALPQHSEPQSQGLRLELEVGKLDARLNLAPCEQVQPYLPAGSKLWGRSRIGLRCVQGQRPWNVFLPVTVRAWGPAWVLAHNVNAGEVLDSSSAILSDVDWAAESSPIIALQQDWVGQVAARHLRAGQALRQVLVRPPEIFQKGATVRVLAQGAGFTLTSSGVALTGAGVGQSVKVRMENGRLVSGTVTPEGDVQVGL